MSLFSGETVVRPNIVGVMDGTAAKAGSVGEFISTSVVIGSAVALTTATNANVMSIVLTPGDWDVAANLNFAATSATTTAGATWTGSINTVSATLSNDGSESYDTPGAITTTSFKLSCTINRKRISVTTTTTIYLVANAVFTAGTVGAYGTLNARRVR